MQYYFKIKIHEFIFVFSKLVQCYLRKIGWRHFSYELVLSEQTRNEELAHVFLELSENVW